MNACLCVCIYIYIYIYIDTINILDAINHLTTLKNNKQFQVKYTYKFKRYKLKLSTNIEKILFLNSVFFLFAWTILGIFAAVANNTLYGSKLYIFLLCQKSLGY